MVVVAEAASFSAGQQSDPVVGTTSVAFPKTHVLSDGEDMLFAFVRITPALLRGAAETHDRYVANRIRPLTGRSLALLSAASRTRPTAYGCRDSRNLD